MVICPASVPVMVLLWPAQISAMANAKGATFVPSSPSSSSCALPMSFTSVRPLTGGYEAWLAGLREAQVSEATKDVLRRANITSDEREDLIELLGSIQTGLGTEKTPPGGEQLGNRRSPDDGDDA